MFDHYYHLKKLCKLFLPLALETNLQIGSFINPVNYKENVSARKEAGGLKHTFWHLVCR